MVANRDFSEIDISLSWCEFSYLIPHGYPLVSATKLFSLRSFFRQLPRKLTSPTTIPSATSTNPSGTLGSTRNWLPCQNRGWLLQVIWCFIASTPGYVYSSVFACPLVLHESFSHLSTRSCPSIHASFQVHDHSSLAR